MKDELDRIAEKDEEEQEEKSDDEDTPITRKTLIIRDSQ